MDILTEIDKTDDIAAVMEMAVDKKLLIAMDRAFPNYNKRVLISSILLKNFKEFYEVDDETFESAKVVSGYLLTGAIPTSDYNTFFGLFNKWRVTDITKLKTEITTARASVLEVRENDPKDEADEQWNTGIDGSIQLMDKRIAQLDDFSISPPQSS